MLDLPGVRDHAGGRLPQVVGESVEEHIGEKIVDFLVMQDRTEVRSSRTVSKSALPNASENRRQTSCNRSLTDHGFSSEPHN